MTSDVKRRMIVMFIFVCSFIFAKEDIYRAASSYENAKEFYESVSYSKKAEAYGGDFYLATMAKLASWDDSLKYQTVGFDITLSGNGASVSFSVALGASMEHKEPKSSNGFEYNLYKISTQSLYTLANTVNHSATSQILSAPIVYVSADAIITTKQYGSLHGSITENGAGGLYENGQVYHLRNTSHKNVMIQTFGNDFGTYVNIEGEMKNTQLSIIYEVGDGVSLAKGYTTGMYEGYSNILYNAYGVHMENYKLMQSFYLLNPVNIGLKKDGYHLESGKEWKTDGGYTFSINQVYMPKSINYAVAYKSSGTVLHANWKENVYYIVYHANGGDGYIQPAIVKYNQSVGIPDNTFSKRGYSLVEGAEWNTKPDGSGKTYSSNQVVNRLAKNHGEVITLYAQWTPNTYEIRTHQGKGDGGTENFYEKYDHGWYSDEDTKDKIENIRIPIRIGYDFLGYLPYAYGVGETIVDKMGGIVIENSFFAEDTMIYANYSPKEYVITFEKNKGTGGSDTVTATFDEYLPYAEGPVRIGYSFKGYYRTQDFSDEIWYIETMAPNIRYTIPDHVTLYAKWIDDIAPKLGISVSTSNWTNRAEGIEINTFAYDLGSGLERVELYCENTLVAELTDLNGTKDTIQLEFVHKTEGVYRYRTVAYDMEGNVSEKYESVKYDIKAPTGTFEILQEDLNDFGVDVKANDYNIQ